MAKAQVEVVVNDKSLDKFKGKVVELQKGLKIQYDINGKPIDVVIDKSLNLQKQVRILTAELRKTKEGTETFTILSQKLNDAKDDLERVNAKSKDLFASLSLIPGPVGDLFGKLNGAIGLLKTFSSFTFKDLSNQFKEVVNDIKDIVKNLLGIKTPEIAKAAGAGDAGAAGATGAAAAAGGTAAAVAGTEQVTKAITRNTEARKEALKNITAEGRELLKNNAVLEAQADGTYKVVDATKNVASAKKTSTVATTTNTAAETTNTVAIDTNTVAKNVNTGATNLLTTATRAAAVATNFLGQALKRIGIGLLIAGVAYLITKLLEYFDSTEEATDGTEKFTKAIENLNNELQKNSTEIDFQTQKAELLAKIQGKSDKEIFEIQKKGLEEQKQLYSKQIGDLQTLRNKAAKDATLTEEQRKTTLESIDKAIIEASKNYVAKRNEIELFGLKERERIVTEDRKKREADAKEADKIELDLKKENTLASIKNERERALAELQIQAATETDKINELLISEEKKQYLRDQIFLKYSKKSIELTKKYNEEDLKNAKDFNRKREDIEIAAIEDKRMREDAERQIKLERALEDLDQDKEFIKKSEEEKERIRQLIRQKYANDEKQVKKDRAKEDRDERLKALDDELKFLQIRQEAIREGTKAFFDSQREILNASEKREIEALDKSLLSKEEYEKQKTAIEEKYTKLRKDLKQQETAATLMAIGQTFDALANLTGALASSYDEEAKSSEEAFKKRQSLQIATATMSAAGGIIQILAQPSTLPSPFDWIVKGINAAALAVATAVQIKNIKNTKFEGGGGGTAGTVRGMARGGYIDGPRHAQGGTLIEAEGGEAVMTRGAVAMFGPLLSMMNQAGGGTSFNRDMMFTPNDAPQSSATGEKEPVIMKTYIVSNELTTEMEKQARLKQLSTL